MACRSSKTFLGTERVNIQFCVETFNISNTPNLLTANNNSNNQAFGNVSIGTISAIDPNYVPRQYQFALKMQCPDESAPRLDTNF